MAVDAAGTERLVAAAAQPASAAWSYLSGAGAAPDARRHWFRAKWRAETAVRDERHPVRRSSARPGSTARAMSR